MNYPCALLAVCFSLQLETYKEISGGPAAAIGKRIKADGVGEVRKGESGSTYRKMLSFAGGRISEESNARLEALKEKLVRGR